MIKIQIFIHSYNKYVYYILSNNIFIKNNINKDQSISTIFKLHIQNIIIIYNLYKNTIVFL
jgi:hypothetical protein